MHPIHPSRSAQRNHSVTRSTSHTALSEPDTYQLNRSHIKHEVNCLSICTSLSRRIRYMHVLFTELHLYQSHLLHQSHISSHRIPRNWGSDGCMDVTSAGLSYRSLIAIVAQPPNLPFGFLMFFLTVHHSIDLFHFPALIHNSFIH